MYKKKSCKSFLFMGRKMIGKFRIVKKSRMKKRTTSFFLFTMMLSIRENVKLIFMCVSNAA